MLYDKASSYQLPLYFFKAVSALYLHRTIVLNSLSQEFCIFREHLIYLLCQMCAYISDRSALLVATTLTLLTDNVVGDRRSRCPITIPSHFYIYHF